MYFKDFSSYSYNTFFGPKRVILLTNVKMIGWLEDGFDYPKGNVDESTLLNLHRYIATASNATIQSKGYHYCNICGTPEDDRKLQFTFEGNTLYLGSHHLWIPCAKDFDVYYAFPNLILHYIENHNYLPPSIFLNAVDDVSLEADWNVYRYRQHLIEAERERIRQ